MIFRLSTENDPLIRHIENAVAADAVSHAYIIEGAAHLNKTEIAESFAKGILCPRRGEPDCGENCGACPVCDKIDHGNHEDMIYVGRVKGKQTLGIDLIRQMQSQVAVKPNGERYIVIIEESELMTEEAQNCLLKTLEEPPGSSVLMLLTDNSERLLPTIRSRCVRYRIEGDASVSDEKLRQCAEELVEMSLSGAPFYKSRKVLGGLGRDRQQAAELIDCMEEQCRERILSRNDNGVPASPAEISAMIDALEAARMQLSRGLNPGSVLKRFLLTIGG